MSQQTLFDGNCLAIETKESKSIDTRNKFSTDPNRPILHKLSYGDTVKGLCKQYHLLPHVFKLCNTIQEINDKILQKYKFVVIPAITTFNEASAFDFEYEQNELCRNFCLIYPDVSFENAEFYLARNNFNLAVAVESYQFDIC